MTTRRLTLALLACALLAGAAPARAALPADFFGIVSEDGFAGKASYRNATMARQASIGIGLIRQTFHWNQIERRPGRYNFSYYDAYVGAAAAHGIRILPILFDPPRFRARTPRHSNAVYPPRRYSTLGNFGAAVARRYGPSGTFWARHPTLPKIPITAYQIWNEPNLTSEWGHRPPDAAAYAALLHGASERIRAADPSALVVMAALSPTLTENSDAQNELVYLQALYDAGIRGSYDVVALQAYGLRGGPDDPRIGNEDVTFSRPTLVHALMVRNGDASTPVWATEMGWNVNPPSFAVQQFGRVTPPLQARYTVRALDRASEQWPWLQVGFVWFWKRADGRDQDQDWYWFRVAEPDFALEPVYYALRDAAETGWPSSR